MVNTFRSHKDEGGASYRGLEPHPPWVDPYQIHILFNTNHAHRLNDNPMGHRALLYQFGSGPPKWRTKLVSRPSLPRILENTSTNVISKYIIHPCFIFNILKHLDVRRPQEYIESEMSWKQSIIKEDI